MQRYTLIAALGAALLAVALGACGGGATAASIALGDPAAVAAAAANAVTVSPLPGTPDASPATQISFLGGDGTKVADVSVVGSHSGTHAGHLVEYSTGTGASFLPAKPFVPGEHVTVNALVGSGAGTSGGVPNQKVTTSFTVANQVDVSQAQFPLNPGDPHAVQHYASAPQLTPSTVTITKPAGAAAAPGDLFMAPYQGLGAPGPMIAEQNGQLVWFHPLPPHDTATNFRVQSYQGQPALTWWQGRIIKVGYGEGEDVIYNNAYQPIATVRAGNGYRADLHEFLLTPAGTAWIDAFDPIHMNLSSVHGSAHGILLDSVIEELDVKTGLVMWEWHALGHIPLNNSLNHVSSARYPWDYVHINSISPEPERAGIGNAAEGRPGNVMLSARNTWTLYDVSMHTGGFQWLLGDGGHSTFKLGAGVRFYWQHDAEFQPGGRISVFNNASTPPKEKRSSGLLLAPNFAGHTVALVKRFANPARAWLASAQGNLLSLPGDDWLMGYGELPNFTEYDGAGHALLEGTLGKNVQDFRTYLSPWSGQPTAPPAIAVQASGAGATVLASWNGATAVASWQVLGGSSAESLAPLATAPRHGFQTAIAVSAAAGSYVAARALSATGQALGTSAAQAVP